MHINLNVMIYMAGSRSLHSGCFEVNNVDFNKESEWTAAVTAYQFIQKIKYDTGYHDDTKVLKITYNGDIDITELVRKVRPVIQNDLPFLLKRPYSCRARF